MFAGHPDQRFKIITAFSDNYKVGNLCAKVNALYARSHGYEWYEEVLTQEDMLAKVAPRTHCTWYKVHMVVEEMRRALGRDRNMMSAVEKEETVAKTKKPLPTLNSSSSRGEALKEDDFLVWMDADAVFVDHNRKLEEIVMKGEQRELIIGEDMHLGNLVNCGVIFIKISEWSLNLWEQVFECRKYDNVTYFEQSALHKVLKIKQEFAPFFNANQYPGVVGKKERDENGEIIIHEQTKITTPWHSFCITNDHKMVNINNDHLHLSEENNVKDRVKVFNHSAIFPMHLLNSNIADEDIDCDGESTSKQLLRNKSQLKKWSHQKTRFIFHAAGFSIKIPKIVNMIRTRLPHIDISEF
eukprot:GFUD01026440.1.p1 GENE.GFUD01026440.1~~GFUD01026440.1.p1  ORF type:complete len:355 (+),score=99.13 GFUD01026440.1:51-1115(+)